MFKVRLLIRLVVVLFLSVFAWVGLKAQQDPQFTQYMNNGLFYNPATAGKDGNYRFSILHRNQWFNYNGLNGPAPTTQLVTATGAYNKLGYGLHLVNDQIGVFNNQELNLSLAYHKKLGMGVLSIGFSGGAFSSTIKFDELRLINPDPRVPQNGRETSMNVNFGGGVFYDRDNLFFGLSSRHLNQPAFDFGDGASINQLKNHTYLLMGYRIKPMAFLSIEPSILIKSVALHTLSYDVSVIATHNQKISGGLAYRGEESVSFLAGYSLLSDKSLRIGYSFDLVIDGQMAKSPTSQEFMVTYHLPKSVGGLQRVIQRTPRFRY
jgi:type IX secretion system PorP/SprF family membrane protein